MLDITFDDMKDVEIKVTEDLFEITNDFLVAGMTGTCGINYKQLKLLGIKTPPSSGWKETLKMLNQKLEELNKAIA